jgi:hypothetical protein
MSSIQRLMAVVVLMLLIFGPFLLLHVIKALIDQGYNPDRLIVGLICIACWVLSVMWFNSIKDKL